MQMHFVKTDNENNQLIYPYTLDMFREEKRNVSLPRALNNAFLATNNVYPVYTQEKPEHDPITQATILNANPVYGDDGWTIGWTVKDKTQQQIDQEHQIAAEQARKTRDKLLSDCDWVTVRATDTETPVPQDWLDYRQTLRDITTQTGFPHNITWPTDPNGYTYGEEDVLGP